MKIIKCDACGNVVENAVKLTIRDGEHPHCGSMMHITIDCCLNCVLKLDDLSSYIELSDLRARCGYRR